jgi:hypothetical protein
MKRVAWFVLSIVVAFVLTGCCCFCLPGKDTSRRVTERILTSPAERQTRQVDVEGAENVDVTVVFGGGTLDVSAGGEALVDAEFVYNLDDLEPLVEYTTQDTRGELLIRQKVDDIHWDPSTEIRNEWQLRFNDRLPLDMDLEVGASQGTLSLGGLHLTHLKLDAGAADISVRFDEPNQGRLESMEVRSGAARLEFLGLGNASPDELWFDGGLGTYTFDFRGDWQRSSTAHIQAGASQVSLRVPRDIGVRVCPGDLRRGEYGGLKQDGDCYVNDLYGQASVNLDIDLDLGLGQLQVRQVN